jgi:DNA repair exonuclease SbcCD ATPase subunit
MDCAICLEPLSISNSCNLPGCNHSFHVSCILSNAQYDTKCPMCREKIPNIHEKKIENNTDQTESLETLYNEYQRKRRRYLTKRRKTIKENNKIKILDTKVKESNKTMKKLENELDKVWNEKTRVLWSEDNEITEIKKNLVNQRKKNNRLNNLLKEKLKDKIGPVPEFEEGFGYILQFMN